MASQLPFTIRRTAASISSTAIKTPARTISASPIFQRRCISAATRGFRPSQQGTVARSHIYKTQQCTHRLKQVRLFSDESTSLREWGFEDINTSLPSDSRSPSHKPVILIDVREPAELKGTGIIPSAISIPLASQPDAMYLDADEFETRFGFPKPQVDGDGTLVFYCKAGVRARAAAQLAVQAGYDPERIGVYEGSWLDWEQNGGKVEKWDGDDF
ncbi:hypothetical protein PENDEC_c008G02012 [Penicillium decumbens]|uniref:Rhodanese domain-containing protein n=1 Tax=Penicillium decumbens TaxID=69771 RepID=A0A1V6PD68_PENDC|nr:hypothetical protein PENDEC_c008G02012 [Penicillium decumbens]